MEKPDITLKLSRPIISYDPNDYIEASVALFVGGYGVGDEYSLARSRAISKDPAVCELEFVYRKNTTLTIWLDSSTFYLELFTLKVATALNADDLHSDQPSPWSTIGDEVVWTSPGGSSSSAFAWFGGSATLVQTDAASSTCLARIKTWMKQCEQEHPYCQDRTRDLGGIEGPPPKRLVSLGRSNADLRLDEIDAVDAPRYVALSYSWGRTKRLTCTQDRYDSLRANIPYDQLAKTLQDAITITRDLGISYIWIDGLCIKQGDAADWESESANMASIYGNAFLTITATGSSDCNDGCFGSRAQTVKVDITEVSGIQTILYARKQIKHDVWDWLNNSAFDQSTRNSIKANVAGKHPLFLRGWCFQERILSRRIIHYTADELMWECLGMTSCECGTLDNSAWSSILQERRHAAGIPPDIEIASNKLNRARAMESRMRVSAWRDMIHNLPTFIQKDRALMHVAMDPKAKCVDVDGDNTDVRQRWCDLVRQYSQKSLTNDTDALPALSGLAHRWEHHGDLGKYVAGLWRKEFLAGLLWKCTGHNTFGERSTAYIAPSWSWASTRKSIDFIAAEKLRLYRVTVLDVACEPAGTDAFGRVAAGSIKLKGRPVEAVVRQIGRPDRLSHAFGLQLEGYGYDTIVPRTNGAHFLPDFPSECQSLEACQVYFLWYCTDVVNLETMQGYQRALVLRQLDDGTFSRIGVREYCSETAWFEEHGDEPPELEMTIV
ncbi:hypothetical protein LTR56_009382 [Elasticomyces elasticus]|nr:hypothetical protein LTR22_022120 [Elasticomyces elasticus]KAK3644995.1 hypothetical protein LTR56_009382 [Elasticomyces elasticus]KAK4906878.1 hypothetical protein LTR49_024028 [Elasticomyces elasticus]KAK5766244.1 hypothetical protein LTS12_003455 [Elasticomyces elasticus]